MTCLGCSENTSRELLATNSKDSDLRSNSAYLTRNFRRRLRASTGSVPSTTSSEGRLTTRDDEGPARYFLNGFSSGKLSNQIVPCQQITVEYKARHLFDGFPICSCKR